ncbi:ppGpp synthetase/RelA/SpoT-type nucleotidyltransferase [Microbacterium amylolyticum]|uniref:PpGpp synthetase/RelA/SpoT-type nucleotidyltransferase n=2 Tax=Microbacterium amylolyticum TaxID=936337 RepID=A0ABS4ZJK6_9MICO|nr:ppGpp synthetase/RelA/SpoT-type nucleotidyltransferase [Microbacterium amylolyticum]
MDMEADIKEAMREYDRGLPSYRALRDALEHDIPLHLRQWGVSYFRVEARVKKRWSFEQKVRRNPARQVHDVVGVRIMAFFRSDLAQIERMTRRLLEVVEDSYIDKGDLLDDESFGYRSVQFVGRTRGDGTTFKETEPGLPVEVQIRTMLEHVWAEVEHDFRYKPQSEPPTPEINRRFALTAALLEQADRNLDDIRRSIEQ